tara:strand:- start:9 stop:266 length:258 start_codon:yes stop_codon:yes gene_type:complete
MNNNYSEKVLTEGARYTIGMNDGCTFKNVIYEGQKQFNGKSMMCFKTDESKQVTVNPSYFSFAIEGITDVNEITYKQGKEKAWAD